MAMHKDRFWSVSSPRDEHELARDLTEGLWTLCTGFRYGGYLYLNDSTSEDAMQEYAVVRERDLVQVESITVTRMTMDRALEFIRGTKEVPGFNYGKIELKRIQNAYSHKTCPLCR